MQPSLRQNLWIDKYAHTYKISREATETRAAINGPILALLPVVAFLVAALLALFPVLYFNHYLATCQNIYINTSID